MGSSDNKTRHWWIPVASCILSYTQYGQNQFWLALGRGQTILCAVLMTPICVASHMWCWDEQRVCKWRVKSKSWSVWLRWLKLFQVSPTYSVTQTEHVKAWIKRLNILKTVLNSCHSIYFHLIPCECAVDNSQFLFPTTANVKRDALCGSHW